MLDAGERRGLGPTAGRDQDVFRGVALAVDLDGVGIDDYTAPVDDFHLRVVQHVDVDLRQPPDFLVLGGDQLRPVETGRRYGPAEPFGVGKSVGELRAVDEELFRHAASKHTGAAHPQLLADRHARAVSAGAARAGDAARAGADREHVEIIARHRGRPPLTRIGLSPGCHNPMLTASAIRRQPRADSAYPRHQLKRVTLPFSTSKKAATTESFPSLSSPASTGEDSLSSCAWIFALASVAARRLSPDALTAGRIKR